jgi:hypothetical protein
MIDLYCERLGPGLWAEPLNALTNIGFLVVAFASWHLARRSGAVTTPIAVLVALMVAVGIGSALFHTFATPWARVLDVVPILLFQLSFLWLYARRVVTLSRRTGLLAVAGVLALALVARLFPSLLNGSLTYVPALLVLTGLGVDHLRATRPAPAIVIAAAGLFALSILVRAVDQGVCAHFELGTHFLWHILNAAVLYLAFRGLIASWPAEHRIAAEDARR